MEGRSMAKNSLSLLSERLVEKNHLDEATADEFIKSLLAVISTGLQQDKLVKVKGWGTLKIISVRDRESIDVNTGERIVIEGRDKLSFTPDAVLREIVNKPFAQFETVIVNDGVDFTPIDEKFAEGMVPEAGEEEEVTTFQTVPVSVTEGQQEEQKDIEKEPLVPSIEKEKDTVEQGEETKLTDLHKPAGQLPATADTTESVPLHQVQENSPGDSPVPMTAEKTEDIVSRSNPITPVSGSNEKHTLSESSMKEEEDEDEMPDNPKKTVPVKSDSKASHGRVFPRYLTYIIGFLFLVLIGALVGLSYNYGRLVTEHNQMIIKLHDIESTSSVRPPRKVTKKHAVPSSSQSPRQPMEKKEVKVHSDDHSSYSSYDSDPRIRTGAYRIAGVERTVTVRSGQTLSGLSRTYLGKGMECYVEALNGTKEVRGGQKLRIPKLVLKKR